MSIFKNLTEAFSIITDKVSNVNGISFPFFGISWDNVNDADKLNIVCELYMVRKVLANYTCPFEVNYFAFIDENDLEDDNPTLATYLSDHENDLFDVCENLEDQLYRSSAYVKSILLNGDKLDNWISIFDFIRTLKAKIVLDSDSAEFEDLIELHNFIVICKESLTTNIAKIPLEKLRLK